MSFLPFDFFSVKYKEIVAGRKVEFGLDMETKGYTSLEVLLCIQEGAERKLQFQLQIVENVVYCLMHIVYVIVQLCYEGFLCSAKSQ